MWLHVTNKIQSCLCMLFETSVYIPNFLPCICLNFRKEKLNLNGLQSMLPKTCLKQKAYFELKTTEKKQAQDKPCDLPITTRKNRLILNHQRQLQTLNQPRNCTRGIYITNFAKTIFIFHWFPLVLTFLLFTTLGNLKPFSLALPLLYKFIVLS